MIGIDSVYQARGKKVQHVRKNLRKSSVCRCKEKELRFREWVIMGYPESITHEMGDDI